MSDLLHLVWSEVADPVEGALGESLSFTFYDAASIDTGGGGGGAVDSVNGHVGVVVLAASDVGADAAGAATAAVAAHTAASDPHPQYLTATDGNAAYDAAGAAATALATALASSQPLDSDLTAIAALTTTTFGRGLLALADASALRTAAGLGTAATANATAFDAAGAAAAAQSASQPVDSDLTAIAALTTTSFGRSFLTLADAAAARTLLGLGGAATLTVGTTAGTVAAGDDSRLSNARTPTAHASTHASGGSDPVTIAESQVTNLTTDLAAKVTADASPAGDPGTPVWKRSLTSSLATTWANLREVWVNGGMKSWMNEWGALRGTSPYTWGDALVRAVRSSGDSITGNGSAVEIVDRRTAGQSNTMWGVGWDGTVRIGGTSSVPLGTATVSAVLLTNGATAPAGLPDGTLIFERA